MAMWWKKQKNKKKKSFWIYITQEIHIQKKYKYLKAKSYILHHYIVKLLYHTTNYLTYPQNSKA